MVTTTASPTQSEYNLPLPDDAIAIVPVRNMVLFPGVVAPVTVGRQQSIAAAQNAIRTEKPLGFVLQRDETTDEPTGLDLHRVGTVGTLEQILMGPSTVPDGTMNLVGALRKAMATTGYTDVKEFQRVEIVVG